MKSWLSVSSQQTALSVWRPEESSRSGSSVSVLVSTSVGSSPSMVYVSFCAISFPALFMYRNWNLSVSSRHCLSWKPDSMNAVGRSLSGKPARAEWLSPALSVTVMSSVRRAKRVPFLSPRGNSTGTLMRKEPSSAVVVSPSEMVSDPAAAFHQ